jgi:hypothetical protein
MNFKSAFPGHCVLVRWLALSDGGGKSVWMECNWSRHFIGHMPSRHLSSFSFNSKKLIHSRPISLNLFKHVKWVDKHFSIVYLYILEGRATSKSQTLWTEWTFKSAISGHLFIYCIFRSLIR